MAFYDARAAKLLQPGQHIVVQDCPGLRLVAGKTSKTWVYRYRSPTDAALRQVKIGAFPALGVGEAISEWQRLRDQREAGTDPAQAKRENRARAISAAAAKQYTIGQMVEDYAAGYLANNREPKGAHAVGLRLRAAHASHADIPAAATTRALVFSTIEALLSTPVAAKSVKVETAAAWRYAVEAGKIPEDLPNWWGEKTSHRFRSKGALRAGEHKGTAKRVLAPQELRVLMREDLNLFSRQVAQFLQLQLWTCTRGGELCQMRRNQIAQEKDGWWWIIPKAEMKGRHVQAAFDLRVPLEGRAKTIVLELLARVPADVPWLFPSRSRDGQIRGQSQAYMQSKVHYMQPYSNAREDHARERLKVTHWSPHDLRRTGRTMLAQMGCPHEVGEAILGHVLPGVAGDYNLYRYDAERRLWLRQLSDRLEQIAGTSPLEHLPHA
ncbi:integrase family protein [Pseudacidovorax sp. RU35E]|uniref:tyrosine-type recombinase/integrase n=1 Tax=Pseudacidovorax sp. RU35E TaxID=1907403 RepID=UPI0009556B85|nr:integrase family protein [Pseudacidovorax sp. RU35E]SIQ00472.1 protein of unknown function [Pseudacidovorax sp. RU35E]